MSVLLSETFKYLSANLHNGIILWFLIDLLVLASSLKIYPYPIGSVTAENGLLSLYRMFDYSEMEEAHLVVHHGRVVAELLIHLNKTLNETFQFDQNKIAACSLNAM